MNSTEARTKVRDLLAEARRHRDIADQLELEAETFAASYRRPNRLVTAQHTGQAHCRCDECEARAAQRGTSHTEYRRLGNFRPPVPVEVECPGPEAGCKVCIRDLRQKMCVD